MKFQNALRSREITTKNLIRFCQKDSNNWKILKMTKVFGNSCKCPNNYKNIGNLKIPELGKWRFGRSVYTAPAPSYSAHSKWSLKCMWHELRTVLAPFKRVFMHSCMNQGHQSILGITSFQTTQNCQKGNQWIRMRVVRLRNILETQKYQSSFVET